MSHQVPVPGRCRRSRPASLTAWVVGLANEIHKINLCMLLLAMLTVKFGFTLNAWCFELVFNAMSSLCCKQFWFVMFGAYLTKLSAINWCRPCLLRKFNMKPRCWKQLLEMAAFPWWILCQGLAHVASIHKMWNVTFTEKWHCPRCASKLANQ